MPPPLSPPPVRTGDAAIIAGDPPPPLSPEVKARLDAAIAPPKEAVAAPGMTLEPVPPKRRVGRPRKDAAAAEAPRPKTWSKQGVPDGMSPEEFAEKKNLLKAQLFAVGHIRGMDFVQQVMDDWGGGKLSQVPFRDYDDVLADFKKAGGRRSHAVRLLRLAGAGAQAQNQAQQNDANCLVLSHGV